MARKKSRGELEAEIKFLRSSDQAALLATITRELIRWSGLAFIVYQGQQIVATLAGETTTANIGINFVTDIRISEAVAWIFGGSGILYGLSRERLRRNTIAKISERNKQLEEIIDPKRTSSHLTERGETRPEDGP